MANRRLYCSIPSWRWILSYRFRIVTFVTPLIKGIHGRCWRTVQNRWTFERYIQSVALHSLDDIIIKSHKKPFKNPRKPKTASSNSNSTIFELDLSRVVELDSSLSQTETRIPILVECLLKSSDRMIRTSGIFRKSSAVCTITGMNSISTQPSLGPDSGIPYGFGQKSHAQFGRSKVGPKHSTEVDYWIQKRPEISNHKCLWKWWFFKMFKISCFIDTWGRKIQYAKYPCCHAEKFPSKLAWATFDTWL